jgi:hypothetical protein
VLVGAISNAKKEYVITIKNRVKDKKEFNKAGKASSDEEEYRTPYVSDVKMYNANTSTVMLKDKRVSKKLKNSIKE